ncbi:MAG: hypothetical protein Tsb0020_21000 [Haliangiales bacterium]
MPVVRESWGNPFPGATLHNVIARLPGTEGTHAVLIMGHYDSIPTGPGASDNGAAVAAMLETMRALRATEPLRNEVVFLFTDGEEAGGLGAEAFRERSWSERFAVVLNFEARGSQGPSLMFETSDGNRALVAALAAASARPFANSISYEAYRRMPVDTDFTVLKEVGAAGLNFAFIHGFRDYHTRADSPERLDLRSLQHHGDTMLGLARHLGQADISDIRTGNAVYFDILGLLVVYYPTALSIPLAIATCLLLAALMMWATHKRRARWRLAGAAAGLCVTTAIVAAVAAIGLYELAEWVRPEIQTLPLGEPYRREWYLLGFVALVFALVCANGYLLARLCSPIEAMFGVLAVLAGLLLAAALTAPGATYIFQWPLLAGALALFGLARRDGAMTTWAHHLGVALAPAIAAVLFVPLVDSVFAGLGLKLAAIPICLSVFAANLALPLVMHRRVLGGVAVTAAIAAVTVIALVAALSEFDRQHPRPNSLVYIQDDELDRAWWVSSDLTPDEWATQVLQQTPTKARIDRYFPDHDEPAWSTPTDDLNLPKPTVEVLEELLRGDVRVLRVRASSSRAASLLQIHIPASTSLLAITLAGERLDASKLAAHGLRQKEVVFQYWTSPEAGMEAVFELPADARLTLRVSDISYTLPTNAAPSLPQRPPDTSVAAFGWALTDAALVSTALEL